MSNEAAGYFRLWNFLFKPEAHIHIESNAVHVIIESFAKADSHRLVIAIRWILKLKIILCEGDLRHRQKSNAKFLGLPADRTMRRCRESMPVSGLNTSCFKKLPDAL